MSKTVTKSDQIKSLISSGNVKDIHEAIRITREKIAILKSRLGKEDENLETVSELNPLTAKSGKKLFRKPTFEKIKIKIGELNKLGDSKLEEKQGFLNEIFKLSKTWYKDHGKSRSKDNLARKSELDGLMEEMKVLDKEIKLRIKAREEEEELFKRIKKLKAQYDKLQIEDIDGRMEVLGNLDVAIFAWYKFDLGQSAQKKEVEKIMTFSRDMTPALMELENIYQTWEEYQGFADEQPDIKAATAKILAADILGWKKNNAKLSSKDDKQVTQWLEKLKSDWVQMQKATAFEIGVAYKSYHYGKASYDTARKKEMLAELQSILSSWRKRYAGDKLGGLNKEAQTKIEVVDAQVQDELGRIINQEIDKKSKKTAKKMEEDREAAIPAETWFHSLLLSYSRYERIDTLDYSKRLAALEDIEEDLEKWGKRYAKRYKGNTIPLQRVNARVVEDQEEIEGSVEDATEHYNKISQLYNGKFKGMKKEGNKTQWAKTETALRKQVNAWLKEYEGINHPKINSMRSTVMELKLWLNSISEKDLTRMTVQFFEVSNSYSSYETAYNSAGATKLNERLGKIKELIKSVDLWMDTFGSSKDDHAKSLAGDIEDIKFKTEGELATLEAFQLAAEIKALARTARSKKVNKEELERLAKDPATWATLEALPLSDFEEVSKLLKYEEEPDTIGEKDFHLAPELEALLTPGGVIPETVVNNASIKLSKRTMKFKNPHKIVFYQTKTSPQETVTINAEATYKTIAWHTNNYIYLEKYKNYHLAAINDIYMKESDTWKNVDPDAFPLFGESGRPTLADVRQGDIGDCYFLAAISSLVQRDPGYVKNMFVDGNDQVSVRLYEIAEPTPGNFTFTPKIYRVHRSVPKDSFNTTNAVWIRMLEKAYIAGECNKNYSSFKFKSYAQIEGGNSDISMMVLLGKRALRMKSTVRTHTSVNFKNAAVTGIEPNGDARVVNLPWSKAEKDEYGNAKTSGDYSRLKSYQIFSEDYPKPAKAKKMVKIWMDYLGTGAIDQLYSREYFGDYVGQLSIEDFEDLFNAVLVSGKGKVSKRSLNKEVANCILKWMKKEKLFPGRRGSGIYSQLQLELFEKIKKALSKGKLVTLSSKSKVGKVVEGLGSSGGEGMSKGLAGGHAYTVLDTNEEPGPTGLKEVLLRNPWGSYGQKNLRVNRQLDELMTEKQKTSDRFGKRREALRRKLEKSGGLFGDTIETDTLSMDSFFMGKEVNKKYQELVQARIEAEYKADKATYDAAVRVRVNAKLDEIVNKKMEAYTEAKAQKDANEKGRKKWQKLTREVRAHVRKELKEMYLKEKKAEIRKEKHVNQWVKNNQSWIYWKGVYEELLKLAEDSLSPKKLPAMKRVFKKYYRGEGLSPEEQTLWDELWGNLNTLKTMKDLEATHQKEAKDTGKFWLH